MDARDARPSPFPDPPVGGIVSSFSLTFQKNTSTRARHGRDASTLGAAGLVSLASIDPGSGKVVKARGARKAPTLTKKKKVLTDEERVVQSSRRKYHRHVQVARINAAAAAALATATQQEVDAAKTSHLVREATREALLMFALNLGQQGLVAIDVTTTSTGSSPLIPPLPDSSCMLTTPQAHVFRPHNPQASRLSDSTGSEHEFPEDYGLDEEEDEVDIDGNPLFFEQELTAQANANRKRKSKWSKACTKDEDKLLCECWIRALQAFEALKAQYEGKSFNFTHFWMIINGEEKFKTQYAAINVCEGNAAVDEHGEREKPRPREKTNSKKEDRREEASLALQATLQGMITNKDSREEKRRQDKEEQNRAFMDIQKKKSVLEAKKQANMLEIEATKAATKAREIWLACMTKGMEIMKVDLSMISPRKLSWFEKMHADMLNLDDE
ncbi:Phospholipid-transporting ATPase 1 [Hordeum vulgare]|nr:Phospholipid-transporting ATPase 1 [Hordeum vulgare]